jgi:hypothetical protein
MWSAAARVIAARVMGVDACSDAAPSALRATKTHTTATAAHRIREAPTGIRSHTHAGHLSSRSLLTGTTYTG